MSDDPRPVTIVMVEDDEGLQAIAKVFATGSQPIMSAAWRSSAMKVSVAPVK